MLYEINPLVWDAFKQVAAQWPEDVDVKLTLELHHWWQEQLQRVPETQR